MLKETGLSVFRGRKSRNTGYSDKSSLVFIFIASRVTHWFDGTHTTYARTNLFASQVGLSKPYCVDGQLEIENRTTRPVVRPVTLLSLAIHCYAHFASRFPVETGCLGLRSPRLPPAMIFINPTRKENKDVGFSSFLFRSDLKPEKFINRKNGIVGNASRQ